MAIISASHLQTILDKAARWAAEAVGDSNVVASPNAGLLVANSDVLSALETAVAGFTDPEQLADLLPSVRDLADSNPILNSWAGSVWSELLDALDAHCRRYGYANLDAYLTYLNQSTPTLRAHGDFSQYLGRVSAPNTFTPGNALVLRGNGLLAVVTVTGAATADFVHVGPLDLTKYAPGQIKVLNTNTEGLTSTVLTFPNAINSSGAESIVATITVQTNGHLTVFSDTGLIFSDCPVAGASISGGNAGDTFAIVIVPDRSVTSA